MQFRDDVSKCSLIHLLTQTAAAIVAGNIGYVLLCLQMCKEQKNNGLIINLIFFNDSAKCLPDTFAEYIIFRAGKKTAGVCVMLRGDSTVIEPLCTHCLSSLKSIDTHSRSDSNLWEVQQKQKSTGINHLKWKDSDLTRDGSVYALRSAAEESSSFSHAAAATNDCEEIRCFYLK